MASKNEVVEAAKSFATLLKFGADGPVLEDVKTILDYMTAELNSDGEKNIARLASVARRDTRRW